jgi:hypothetical protein
MPCLRAFVSGNGEWFFLLYPKIGVDWYLPPPQFSSLIQKKMRLKIKFNFMKKFIRRVVKAFKKLADSKFLTFGENVTAGMAAAVDVFTNPVPALAAINAELANYSTLIQTSASRDKVQVQLKNKSKFTLQLMLGQLADYVNTTTSDSADLSRTGFELNKLPQPITITAPTTLRLMDGENSGRGNYKVHEGKGRPELPVPIQQRHSTGGIFVDQQAGHRSHLHLHRAYKGHHLPLSRGGRWQQPANRKQHRAKSSFSIILTSLIFL